ncbi:hypothetical protein JW824_12685 [bacterium]|nr:hypothetical protein [bacterium]
MIFSGILIGLVIPGIESTPKELITLCLASNIFFSCFRVTKRDFSSLSLHRHFIFYGLRFLLLPAILFWIARQWIPGYAISVLLISLMPAGTASPAVALILEGNIGLTLSMLVFSSLFVPVTVPAAFFILHGASVSNNIGAIFISLILVVIVPVLVHLPLRSGNRFKKWAQINARFISALLVTAIIILVVGIGREAILSDPTFIFESLGIVSILYFIYYLFGWLSGFRTSQRDRIGLTVVSGVNNNALGTGIALLHFQPQVALFLIISEVPWTLGIAAFGRVLKGFKNRDAGRIKRKFIIK